MTPEDGTTPSPEPPEPASAPILTRTVTVPNARGLHARAAAKFVMMAERFGASVDVIRDGQCVSARSIMGLMMLGAGAGGLPPSSSAPKAGDAGKRSARRPGGELVESGFEMSRTGNPPPPQHKRLGRDRLENSRPETRFAGIAISAGVAIGPVFQASEPTPKITRHKIQAADSAAEGARLDAAIAQSRKQLAKLRARLAVLPEESQAEIAPLIDAYIRMQGLSRLIRAVRKRIEDTLLSAESAVVEETEAIAAAIMAQAEPGMPADDRASLARRGEEVREIGRRLVRNLTRAPYRSFAGLPEGAVLISEALRPSDAALLDPSRLAGVATEEGGAEGHTAVMLRALGVPAVLGATGLAHAIRPGDVAVVDGSAGTVMLNPSGTTLAAARRAVTAFARERQRYAKLRRLPAETLDGAPVELQANLELPLELPLIAQSGAVGIGLLRTEFLFMNRETMPDEDTQTETYRGIVEAMGGDPVVIRVLDWGGEKDIEALSSSRHRAGGRRHTNPALGLRGLRLLLRRTELLETQLRPRNPIARQAWPARCG